MAGLVIERVRLVVDGYELEGWQEVSIRRSMQNAAIAFTLKATHVSLSPAAKKLRKAAEIELYTSVASGTRPSGGGDLVCKGAIDSYEADIGEGAHKTVTLHGRSHARDVVDCPPVNHATGRVENKDILGVAREFGGEFAVEWASDISLEKIDKVQRIPGETLFQTIERLARIEAVMLLGRPDGSILITRAGSKRHGGALVEGKPPVNRVSIKLVPEGEASEIHVLGQRATGTGKDNLRQKEVHKPGTAGKRHRPRLAIVEGDRGGSKLKTRGKWHHLRSFAGNLVAPRVSTWRDADGLLWEPGRLIALQVPSEDLDVDFVLSEVTLRQGIGDDNAGEGTRADLVCVDPKDLGGGGGKGNSEFDPGEGL